MKQFTMVYLYSEHYEESFYHESEEALFVLSESTFFVL